MSSPIALQEFLKAGFEDFIIPSYEAAPFTTIQNRAMVTRSMKAIAGVERIHTKGINLLPNEFGPNGQTVFESSDKDSRVRFVGSGWSELSNTYGAYIQSTTTNDSLEITFYGTGLNVIVCAANSAVDVRPSVDGGAEGSDIFPAVISNVIGNRNYAPNIVVSVVSGLTLGLHTVKLRISSSALEFTPNGFEILNQRTDLAVYSGTGISNGSSQGLSALATSAFNAGVSGTRGARIVKYIQNGVVSQAVQEVDATSKYLTLADHTNEEVVRRINFREFGANRADDFSTLTTVSNRAFTLDDGTTTLVGLTVKGDTALSTIDALRAQAGVTNFFTKTFIGTGLDVIVSCDATIRSTTVLVDGVSIGTLTSAVTINGVVYKICSGLPYGTHTIKFLNTSAGSDTFGVSDFIIYQPKTPSIPAGALKVAAYNVMANYVANTVAGIDTIGTGVLRKLCSREFTYVGTYTAALAVGDLGGIQITSSTVGNYDEYTFFGTGVDIRVSGTSGGATTNTVSIDGSSNFSGNTTSFYGTGVSFVASTGVMSMAISAAAGGVSINGLALGKHTIRITKTTGAFSFYNTALDIITPIHAQESSLKVGSQSIHSVTKYSPEKSISNAGPDLSKAKAYLYFDGASSKILNSMNISAVLNAATGGWFVYFEKPFKNENFIITGMSESNEIQFDRVPGSASVGASRVSVYTSNAAGTYQPTGFCIVCFGELIDEN